jgi:LPS-assembly lipoprotein
MWSSEPRRRQWLAAALLLPLAGCGFELRRAAPLGFERIALTGFAPSSPLGLELRRQLASSAAQVVESPLQAQVVLQVITDAPTRVAVATTSAAQVRELTLRLKLVFRVQTPAGRELIGPSELTLSRDMSYSENAALAKEQEEAEVFREMQTDIASQVLRRLAAIKL